jgi:ABC-type dipeptide/oligopeptide/nickel transport system permease subunit
VSTEVLSALDALLAPLRLRTEKTYSAPFVCVELAPLYHVLGTDKVGQDVLYLALKSMRTALVIGTLTTLVMLPFAVALGIAAGYLGGWVDDADPVPLHGAQRSIPGVLLIAAAVLMMQVVIDTHPTGSTPRPSARTRACWRCA